MLRLSERSLRGWELAPRRAITVQRMLIMMAFGHFVLYLVFCIHVLSSLLTTWLVKLSSQVDLR